MSTDKLNDDISQNRSSKLPDFMESHDKMCSDVAKARYSGAAPHYAIHNLPLFWIEILIYGNMCHVYTHVRAAGSTELQAS